MADSYLFKKANYRRELASASRNNANSSRRQSTSESLDLENTVTHYHKVVAGETLTSIAKKRNTTVDQICRMNHISKSVKVRPGQILRYN